MNIKSGYAFENCVAKIFAEAGYSIEQNVQLENRQGDIGNSLQNFGRKQKVLLK